MSPDDLRALFANPSAAPALIELARDYLEARDECALAEAAQKAASARRSEAEGALFRALDEAGLRQVEVDGVNLQTQEANYYQVSQEALSDNLLLAWLLANGGRDLVKRTVNAQSFTAFCRKLAEAGKSVPSAIRRVTRRVIRMKEK